MNGSSVAMMPFSWPKRKAETGRLQEPLLKLTLGLWSCRARFTDRWPKCSICNLLNVVFAIYYLSEYETTFRLYFLFRGPARHREKTSRTLHSPVRSKRKVLTSPSLNLTSDAVPPAVFVAPLFA